MLWTKKTPGIGSLAGSAAAALAVVLLLGTPPAQADAVLDWNEIADVTSVAAGAPPVRARITAMTQIAVHDALNSIEARYLPYTDSLAPANPGASPEAAVAAAAYNVLVQTVPSQAAALLLAYESKLAGLACPAEYPSCVTDGVLAGEATADAILALRTGDGSATPHAPYTLPPGPGVWQPTPPALSPALFGGWAHLTPFVLNSGSQFRAPPTALFQLNSAAYARDYNEVKLVGRMDAETNGYRTADQSAIARFWPGAGASAGSNFNAVTRVIVAGRGLDAWQHARLLALVNIALSDSAVAVFETKYAYNFWRPVTAIRAGATDGNSQTEPDSTWLSYQPTPPYPDYTCGLTTNTGAALEVLRRYFGTDKIAYTFTAVGITRSYSSLSEAAAEAVDARVFGGMHFRTGCVVGIRQGEQVGRFVIQNSLRPLNPSEM